MCIEWMSNENCSVRKQLLDLDNTSKTLTFYVSSAADDYRAYSHS